MIKRTSRNQYRYRLSNNHYVRVNTNKYTNSLNQKCIYYQLLGYLGSSRPIVKCKRQAAEVKRQAM